MIQNQMRLLPAWLLLALMFLLSASLVVAQTASTGALTGTVTDPSGAVLPGTTVTLTSNATGQVRTATTDSTGVYKFTLIQPGTYMVTFSVAGFRTAEVGPVTVNVSETPMLNQMLEIGAQQETVTVTGEAAAIQTDTSSLGSIVDSASVTSLPLSSRNFTQILALSTGVSSDVADASSLGAGSLSVTVQGQGRSSYQLDGASINASGGDEGITGSGFYGGAGIPNPDTIQEFKVQTSSMDAGYGRNTGANVNVVMKTGTNDFHGSVFEFVRNTSLNANDFFLNRSGKARGRLDQHQFGATIGGPIVKDKLFFFFSYQGTRQRNGLAAGGLTSGVTLVPVPDRSAPNFQELLGQQYCPENHPGDPRYRTFHGGVQVACDGSNINPIAIKLLQTKSNGGNWLIPGSTTGDFLPGQAYSSPATYKENQYITSVDYLMTTNNTLSARYNVQKGVRYEAYSCGFFFGPCSPGNDKDSTQLPHTSLLKLTSVLSPTVVNEARVSYMRYQSDQDSFTVKASEVGITPNVPAIDIMPTFGVFGMFGTAGAGFFASVHNIQNLYQYGDQISWVKGRHTIRAGFEVEHDQLNWNFPSLSSGAAAFFSMGDLLLGLPGCTPGDATCSPDNPGGTTGTPFSNIEMTLFAIKAPPGGLVVGYRYITSAGFIQDDFKVTPRLTLNMGLRWEFVSHLSDKYGHMASVWPSLIKKDPIPATSREEGDWTGFVVANNYKGEMAAGVFRNSTNYPTRSGPPKNNFAPRFGLAWRPFESDRFVVRGGYGWFYDRVEGNAQNHATMEVPPYAGRGDRGGPANYFSTWSAPFIPDPVGWGPSRWVNFETGAGSNLSVTAWDDNIGMPMVQQWNIGFQYEFVPRWVLDLSYVGSHGLDLYNAGRGANLPTLASESNPVNGITTNTIQNAPLRVRYLGFAPSGVQLYTTEGSSKFHSMQLSVSKRMSHGLQLQLGYTWLKNLTTQTGNPGHAGAANNYNDPYDAKIQYGRTLRPHRFVANYLWEIPGPDSGFISNILGGWGLSGVTTVQAGAYLALSDTSGGTIYGASSRYNTIMPQLASGMTHADILTSGSLKDRLGGASGGPGYFNKSAFSALPKIGNGTGFGDLGPGVVRGPGQTNWDLSLTKSFAITALSEGARVEFRAEAFNLFNTPNFSNPASLDVSNPRFGHITGTSVNPRLFQFALKFVF